MLEPLAAKAAASSRKRRSTAAQLRVLIEEERAALEDPESFGQANVLFHERLVELAGNQTLSILTEMLDEIVLRAVTAVSRGRGHRRFDRHPPARNPIPGAPRRAHRRGQGGRGRGALAIPHVHRQPGDARPGGRDGDRPPPPPGLNAPRTTGSTAALGAGQAEAPLGDDPALHLARAAVDRQNDRVTELVGELTRPGATTVRPPRSARGGRRCRGGRWPPGPGIRRRTA